MSYNILEGGNERLPFIIKTVLKISPDFLTINEANGFDKDAGKRLTEFSKSVRLPYTSLALSGEADYHVAVFSRIHLKSVTFITPLSRAGIHAVMDTPFGELSIAGTHLSPFSEAQRIKEVALIINAQKKHRHKILMGDLNSLSPHDDYPAGMIKKFNKKQKLKFMKNGKIRSDVIRKIEANGYTDAAVTLDKNNVTTVPTTSNMDEAHANMRLDYMFLSESLRPFLKTYDVIKNKITGKGSDHYPVIVALS